MKKSLAVLSLGLLFALASCQKATDTTKRSDNPSDINKTALKLDLVNDGVLLKEIGVVTDYVSVKIPTEYKDSLFYVTTDLTETLEAHGTLNKNITISPLTFTSNITDAEKSSLASYVYSDTGIYAKDDLGFTVSENIKNWQTNVDILPIAKEYTEAKANYYISVIYVPALAVHYANTYTALECYVMFPLYYQVYKEGAKEAIFDSKAKDLTSKLEFNNNLLKSQETVSA